MPYYEFQAKWTWVTAATTGAMDAVQVRGRVERFTFGIQTDAGCTCTVQMQAGPESTGPWVGFEASTAISTSAYLIQQHAGPVEWIRPYVVAKSTGVLIVTALGN